MRAGLSSCVLVLMTVMSCKPSDSGTRPEGDDGADGGDPTDSDTPELSFYDQLTWEATTVDQFDPTRRPGYQGRLVRDASGTLYHASFHAMGSYVEDGKSCDIAMYGGGAAPASQYQIRVAVRAPGASDWQVETVPLDSVPAPDNQAFVGALYGLDATLDGQGRLVLAFAGGGPGHFTCASSDLVIATRAAAGGWSFDVPVTDSDACCTSDLDCADPFCTSGTDVGAWAAVATMPDGRVAAAYVDHHFTTDDDGQTFQGYELWEPSGVSGIRPWSGLGAIGALRWVNGVPLSVFTAFNGGGLYVLRRTGNDGHKTDWVGQDLRPGWIIGERISLAVSDTDGTVGIAFHTAFDDKDARVDDLVYCYSSDGGATWSVPCENVDSRVLSLGQHPSLAFDPEGRAVISYYYCGANYPCTNGEDGLRLAWREGPGDWHVRTLQSSADSQSGTYSQLVIDPDTGLPTVVFQDVTNSAVIALQAELPGG